MALVCPQCATAMKEVAAPAVVGYAIVLDQCPGCGGIWCDRWEVYPLTAAGAAQLDRVDCEALQQPRVASAREVECPRCRARLRPFQDRSLPADAQIARCPNCDGMWLNRGELRRFKHRGGAPRAMSEEQLDRLVRATGVAGPPAKPVRDLAQAFDPAEPAGDSGELRQQLVSGAAWLAVRTLLRLLLHL